MRDIKEEIEDAREKVAHFRIRAERPQSRLEDDYALEKARNRLLTLELRQLKLGRETGQANRSEPVRQLRAGSVRGSEQRVKRTKREHDYGTARERAEQAFAGLQKKHPEKRGGV